MNSSIFGYLAGFFLLLPLAPLIYELDPVQSNVIALSFILLLGIPHGAVDNQLFLEKSSISIKVFYIWYIGAILVNALVWIFLPVFSFIVFLFISAYHFGQSQFNRFEISNHKIKTLFYVSWGLMILSLMIYFNVDELSMVIAQTGDLIGFEMVFEESLVLRFLVASSVIYFSMIIYLLLKAKITYEKFLMETIIVVLVAVTGYLYSFLLSFMLFFVTIHSFKVMQEEFRHYYRNISMKTMINFLKRLLPLTLLSFMGIALIFIFIEKGLIRISYPLVLLIMISSITLPHVFVMERFYTKAKS